MESQQYQNEFPEVELEDVEPSLKEKLHSLTQIHQDIEKRKEKLTQQYKSSKRALEEIERQIEILRVRFNHGAVSTE